ncbi:hypothetical protein SUGI_0601070 [Cryptomeria japonica]|nr:hypothetical protein SUGI_0601070 [Cryptomeria japonica]
MGIWNAHTSIGNICGSLIAVAVLQYGWGWSFLLPGILVAVAAIIVYLFLVVNPEDVVDEVRSERINLEDRSLLKCGEVGLLKETLPPTESHRGPVKVFIELSKTGTSCNSMNGAIDPSKAEIHGDSGDGKHDTEESSGR